MADGINYFRLLWNLYRLIRNTGRAKEQIERLQKKKLEKQIAPDQNIGKKALIIKRMEDKKLHKFSDEQFMQPRICVEALQILLIAEQNLRFCSRPRRKRFGMEEK